MTVWGKVDVGGDAKLTDRRDGRLAVSITPKHRQFSVAIRQTDPKDPVRNIRFIPRDAD